MSMTVERPNIEEHWRQQFCSLCGHEWACLFKRRWYCARCQWPPPKETAQTKPAQEANTELKVRLLAWIDEQEAIRTGDGGYAKGQRVMLQRFRELINRP